jgi:hypothetical protein
MVFVTRLPSSNGFDTIWVVINYLTKLRYFAPVLTMSDAKGLTQLFLSNIFHLHGLLDTIGSELGPQFALCLWKHLCNCLKTELHLRTAFYP